MTEEYHYQPGWPPQNPVVEIPSSGVIKVYREGRIAAGYYGTWPADRVNEVEELTRKKWGGGDFRFEAWDGATPLRSWTATLPGSNWLNADEEPIDRDSAPSAPAPSHHAHHSAYPPPPPYGHQGYGSGGMVVGGAFPRRGAGDSFLYDQVDKRDRTIAQLQRELNDQREVSRRAELEASEWRQKHDAAVAQAAQAKVMADLQTEIRIAQVLQQKGGGGASASESLLVTLFPTLIEAIQSKGDTDLGSQLDVLAKLKELAGDSGGGDDSAGGGLAALVPVILAALAGAGGAGGPGLPGGAPPPEPAPSDPAPEPDQPPRGTQTVELVPYAGPGFAKILANGLNQLNPDHKGWAKAAYKHTTTEGREALKTLDVSIASLKKWCSHIPGVTVSELESAIEGHADRMAWIAQAFIALKERTA